MLLVLTIASMLLALIMSFVAWRTSNDERRRSDARVAALAREIHGDQPAAEDFDMQPPIAPQSAEPARLFGAAAQAASGSRWGLSLAVGALVVASVAAAAILFSGESPAASTSGTASTPAAPTGNARAAAPLELIALTHERDGDRLTVRGVIRNPAAGAEMDRLTAVVFVFDRDGGFLTSARAAVESPALIPGGESAFVVSVPAARDVARYRVSFRSDEHVVSHVDKRRVS